VARFDRWVTEPILAVFALENHGGKPIDRATVKVVTRDGNLVGFADDETMERHLEHVFQQLKPGIPRP
jgi:hypothetical protein